MEKNNLNNKNSINKNSINKNSTNKNSAYNNNKINNNKKNRNNIINNINNILNNKNNNINNENKIKKHNENKVVNNIQNINSVKKSLHKEQKNIFSYFVLILLFALVIIFIISVRKCKSLEGFAQLYKQDKYGNLDSTYDDNTDFYKIPIFRKPYRWPVGIEKSYPCRHISPLSK